MSRYIEEWLDLFLHFKFGVNSSVIYDANFTAPSSRL